MSATVNGTSRLTLVQVRTSGGRAYLSVFDGTTHLKGAFVDRDREGEQIVLVPNLHSIIQKMEKMEWSIDIRREITDSTLKRFETDLRVKLEFPA